MVSYKKYKKAKKIVEQYQSENKIIIPTTNKEDRGIINKGFW